jgi:Transposase DDE domain
LKGPRVKPKEITQKELGFFRLHREFREHLAAANIGRTPHSSFGDKRRLLDMGDYLGLMLFGLLNPVANTLRGLSAASRLPKVRREICSNPVSLGSFSEAQHLVDPAILQQVFESLSEEVRARHGASMEGKSKAVREWMSHDGSVWPALPRMTWALFGAGRNGDANGVKLHLSFHVGADTPAKASVCEARVCERAELRKRLGKGGAYVADRYFGIDYGLFDDLRAKGCSFCIRVRDSAVVDFLGAIPLAPGDAEAGVLRQDLVRLGGKRKQSEPLRLIQVKGVTGEILFIVSNLKAETLSAADLALLYKQRWGIEYYFRWVKCVMGCGHWMAESRNGATLQIHLALIASLLLQLQMGKRPSKRIWELMRWHSMGMATSEDVAKQLDEMASAQARAEGRRLARENFFRGA